MSRVGKQPVALPSGVKGAVDSSGNINIEGPRGKLSYKPAQTVKVVVDAGKVVVSSETNDSQKKADFGSARAHINNMVLGVSKGWKKSLELVGVGFAAKTQGQDLVLSVGFSHDVILNIPKAVKCTVTKTNIEMESNDKEVLGSFAAKIRKVQPPEPYLGKGIKYSDEVIRRKAGKTGKK